VAPAVAQAQSGDSSDASATDVFRHSAHAVGPSDTSSSGTDLFRRASARRESFDHGPAADSVVIDGAKVPLDTAHADAVVSRDDISEHLARPVKARPAAAATAPAPSPVASAPVAPAPAAPAPVAPAPVVPAPAAPAPAAPAPAVVAAPSHVVSPAPVAAPAPTPAPAPVVAAAAPHTVPKLGPSRPTVKAPPPPDSAQLVREVAELQREVAPKLQTVGTQVDSVRQAYNAQLDRLAREAPLPDTMEQRMLQAMIDHARFKGDTATPAPSAPPNKKSKKVKTDNTN
jgi:hypothetical protein